MELSAHYQKISELTERLSVLSDHLELEEKQERLEEVKLELENPDVWSNPEKAQSLGKERVQLDNLCETFSKSNSILSDAKELLEMAESENDVDTVNGLLTDLDKTENLISKYEFERMFSGEMDRNSAYLDIQSGSGGTEAQDWAEMILRMYLRWGDKHNFNVKLMEVSAGDVAGIKSATIHFDGEYAFGWLRSEIGIHRLVRKSPYNANGKRHTSFSSVFVSPEIKLGKAKVPLIITNHTYDVVGSMFPQKEMGGGSGLKYAASSIIYLSKRKEKDGTEVVGNIIHCKNYKSRLTKENKVVDVRLTYDKGLDRYYGLLDLALKHNIFKQVSTRIELPDGSKTFGKTINNDPTKYFTKEILEQLDEVCTKEFKYGETEDNDTETSQDD